MEHRPIEGFSNYAAREDGQIVRLTSRTFAKAGTVLAGGYVRHGYRGVALQSDDKRQVTVPVHLLIAKAFHGPKPDGAVCRHLNGDKMDNRPANLAWGTAAENYANRDAHGTTAKGTTHGCAKLTEEQVVAIRSSTAPQRALAKQYGVSQAQVSDIKLRKVWKHL